METNIKTDRIKLCGTANSREEAQNIFKEIEDKTGARIQWVPGKFSSTYKGGPTIRLCGSPDQVKIAKEMVLQNLEIQSNRVVMKMDITHEEHPSLIGKKGSLIKQVMEHTNCHIHFPDTNLRPESIKSNQVSISGSPSDVEKARIMLRALLPFQVTFNIDVASAQMFNSSYPIWKTLEEQLGLEIHFLRHREYTSIVLRCSQGLFPSIRQQILGLMELLTQKRGSDLPPVIVKMDIMPQHHSFVKGVRGSNVQAIMNRTGAQVFFPNSNTDVTERRYVKITGNLDCVYMAWQEIMSYLPVGVIFDVSETRDTNIEYMDFLNDCNISVYTRSKPSHIKAVIVKGPEKFSKQILQFRQKVLSLSAIKFPPDMDDVDKAFSLQNTSKEIPVTQILKNLASATVGNLINSTQFESILMNTSNLENNIIQASTSYNVTFCPSVTVHNVSGLQEKAFTENGGMFQSSFSSKDRTTDPSTMTIDFWGNKCVNNDNEVLTQSEDLADISLLKALSTSDRHLYPDSSPLKIHGVSQFEIFEKRLSAHQAIHRQIESTQVPSSLWAGYGFSQSMPAAFVKKEKEPSKCYSTTSLESNSSSSSEDSWNNIIPADYINQDSIWSEEGDGVYSLSNVFDFKRNISLPKTDGFCDDILPELLFKEGLYNYIDVFLREEIDFTAFLLLNETDLIKLGIRSHPARMKITCLIRELKDSQMKTFDAAPGAGRRAGAIQSKM